MVGPFYTSLSIEPHPLSHISCRFSWIVFALGVDQHEWVISLMRP